MASIQIRRDTAANFTSANLTLAQGEWALETDTKKIKIGDGTSTWTSLGYAVNPSGTSSGAFPAINTTAVTASGTITTNQVTEVNAGSAVALLLPTGASAGAMAVVKRIDTNTQYSVTITPASGTQIDGSTSGSVSLAGTNEVAVFEADSSGNWWVVSGHKPLSFLDARYAQAGSLHWPYGGYLGGTNTSSLAIGTIYGRRFICTRTGSFTNASLWLAAVGTGTHAYVGLYDTGDASTGNRTLLASSASTTLGTGTGYQTIQFVSSYTVKMGQHVDLVVILDTATSAGVDTVGVANLQYFLPTTGLASSTAFLACPGGAPPKLAWGYAAGAYAAPPSTIAEANLTNTAKPVAFLATIQ